MGADRVLRKQLAANGTPLHCDPVTMVFSAIYRADTNYHANAAGARLRSASLAECLVKFIAGQDVETAPIDPVAAASASQTRIDQQLRGFGVGDLPVQKRLRDLEAMNAAILAYHAQFHAYPVSDEPGGSGLPERLVAQFPPSLPVDPGGKGAASYAYWSDGTGYKLVAFAPPEDCTLVSAYWPAMIDRPGVTGGDPTLCKAYGYWTADQASRQLQAPVRIGNK